MSAMRRRRPKGSATKFAAGDVKSAYLELAATVVRVSGGSALHGLETVAVAFSALLDTYSKPNANNPSGMCDDPKAFRQHFASLITEAPSFEPAAKKGREFEGRR